MQSLAEEYKISISILSKRINELVKLKKFLTDRTKGRGKNQEIMELEDRLRPLKIILRDLREVTDEVEHYFDKGWWRSEKYTFNARKSRKFVYVGFIYDSGSDEHIPKG